MKVLITGASSGIGRSMAKYLSSLGHDLILVARDKEKLQDLQRELNKDVKIIVLDLSNTEKIKELYVLCRNDDIDVLINNAGFGLYGEFKDTDINKEMEMIDVNIKAVQFLTKLFLKDMIRKDSGYILNVSSSAAFQPGGPKMSTYYATKAYINSLTLAIYEELRRSKSNVSISCFSPGPVDTNFNKVAGVKFSIKPISSDVAAKYAIDNMFKKKMLIVPTFKMKLAMFFTRFLSRKKLLKISYKIQSKKEIKNKNK